MRGSQSTLMINFQERTCIQTLTAVRNLLHLTNLNLVLGGCLCLRKLIQSWTETTTESSGDLAMRAWDSLLPCQSSTTSTRKSIRFQRCTICSARWLKETIPWSWHAVMWAETRQMVWWIITPTLFWMWLFYKELNWQRSETHGDQKVTTVPGQTKTQFGHLLYSSRPVTKKIWRMVCSSCLSSSSFLYHISDQRPLLSMKIGQKRQCIMWTSKRNRCTSESRFQPDSLFTSLLKDRIQDSTRTARKITPISMFSSSKEQDTQVKARSFSQLHTWEKVCITSPSVNQVLNGTLEPTASSLQTGTTRPERPPTTLWLCTNRIQTRFPSLGEITWLH